MPPVPKKIRIKETGQVFMGAREVARFIGGDFSSIYNCLRGFRKSHKGFTFEYVDDDESA